MERDQVVELFRLIKSFYPNFEVSSEKVDAWHRIMKKMDFDRVVAKLEQHAAEKPFPPTIAEIAAYAPEENKHLEQIQKWREEAAKVSPEVKERFRKELERLAQKIEEKNK